MRKFLFSVMLVVSAAIHAQSVDSMFVSMPDSLFPYLSSGQRSELVNLRKVDTSTAAVLRSPLNCEVTLCYADAERMTLVLDSAVTMELAVKKLDGNAVCCLLRTVGAPEKITSAMVYDGEWKELRRLNLDTLTMVQRPDTMSVQHYEELCKLIEFPLMEAHFEDAATLVVKQNVPMASKEERARLEAILKQRKLRW